jgi:hypothetical protein
VSSDRRLNEEEAALVFRRAAELDSVITPDAPGLDAATLERVGVEAGLSPAAVRQALAELRSGQLRPAEVSGRGIGPARIEIERWVRVPPRVANERLESYLRKQAMRVVRRRGAATIWEPSRSLVANVARGIGDVTDRMRLSKVNGVELHVESDGDGSFVRIVIDVAKIQRGARSGSIAGAVVGVSGWIAGGIGLALGAPEVMLAAPASSALGAGAFFGARSSYSKQVKRAINGVELALDELDR